MLFFLSKKYFGSRNCLKEIVASLEQGKPLVLVQEQQEDKGGGPLEILKAECRNDEMREAVFEGRTPIAWHRISHFQNLTLKLIATEMLRNGPRFQGSLSGGNAPEDPVLIQHGEVNTSKLTLPQPLVLWCSAGNPGAADVAEELVTSMANNGTAIRVVDTMPDVQALREYGESAVMLLYLNKDTWVEQGEVLERDVRAARKLQADLKVVLVHENDKAKGGCEFGDLFGTTPQELIDDGIYRSGRRLTLIAHCPIERAITNALCVPCGSDIAIALHTPPHRAVSLALVAQALGATQGKGLLSRIMKTLPMVAAMNLESPLNSVGSALLSWLATKRKTTLPVVGSGTTEDTSTVCHGDVNLLQRQRQRQQQVQGAAVQPPRAAQQQQVQRTLSANKPSAVMHTVGFVRHDGCALDLLSRMRAALHDEARGDAVVGSTGPVREGAPLGQIQRRARSQTIQRGAGSHVIQRARSHSLQRAKINTQLTLQPVDNVAAGSSSSHAAGTVGGAEGGSKGGTEVAMGLRGCAPQAAVTPRATSVELVRTPIGLGLTVDSHYKVLAIAKDSQAKRSRGIAVGDQLVAINDVPLSGGGSFDEQLSAIALGTKVRLVISKPAGSAKTSRIGGLMSV